MTKTSKVFFNVAVFFAAFFFSSTAGAQLLMSGSSSYTLVYYSTCQDVMERAVDFENAMTDCDQQSSYTKQRLACYKQVGEDVFKYKRDCESEVFDATFEHIYAYHGQGSYNYTSYKNYLKGKIQQCETYTWSKGGQTCFYNLYKQYSSSTNGYYPLFKKVVLDYYYKSYYTYTNQI